MKLKMNYGALERVMVALQRMSSLTGKAGYAVMRTMKNLEPEYEIFTDLRNSIIRKYAPDGSDGIRMSDPGFEDCRKEYDELIAMEIDAEIYQIGPEDFDIDNVYCEAAQAADYEIVEALIVKKDEAE